VNNHGAFAKVLTCDCRIVEPERGGWSRTMVTQQNLLDHAEVCARLLRKTSDPKERLVLWQLRELWNALAVDGLHQKDIDEQVEALADAEAKFFAKMEPVLR
jgi:hypothetical protein